MTCPLLLLSASDVPLLPVVRTSMACACRTRFPLLWRDGYDGYPLRVSFANASVSSQVVFQACLPLLLSRILRCTSARTSIPSHVVDDEGMARLLRFRRNPMPPSASPRMPPFRPWFVDPWVEGWSLGYVATGRWKRGETGLPGCRLCGWGRVVPVWPGRRSRHGGAGSLPDVARERGDAGRTVPGRARRVNQASTWT